MELPKHLLEALANGNVSIGYECFPPDEEEKYAVMLITNYVGDIEGSPKENQTKWSRELSECLKKCKELEKEQDIRDTLEKTCADYLVDLFQIPDNTIVVDLHIMDNISASDERILPEKTSGDFSFEDIHDMEGLTNEIYRRRLLNCLIAGCANYYAANLHNIANQLYFVNPELVSLYPKIMELNKNLMYVSKDIIPQKDDGSDGGKVDVFLNENGMVRIDAEGVIMPVLLEEAIKGILELAISHGLPKSREKANYIISKSDYKLAEQWDMRLGCPLWARLEDMFENCGIDITEVGLSFFFMTIAQMDYEDFKPIMQEIFGNTRKGQKYLKEITDDILYEKGQTEFLNHINQQRQEHQQINDDDYYSPEELLTDEVDYTHPYC